MSRTAVVIIHGIGEQRPMGTLRNFVRDIISPDYLSKPDLLSELYEVRRLNCNPVNGQNFDCYELYWAHHMRDSGLWHLLTWLIRLLSIHSDQLEQMSAHIGKLAYKNAQRLGVLFIVLILVVSVMIIILLTTWGWLAVGPGAVVAILAIFTGKSMWSLVQTWLVTIAGDVARYCDSTPDNIAQRQAIRVQCVKFLRSLDQSTDPCYDRIVLIGHSLGSVISYDALKLMWATLPNHARVPRSSLKENDIENRVLQCLYRSIDNPTRCPGTNTTQVVESPPMCNPQDKLFAELARSPAQWKISDLITVGSPLVHASILFAGSMDDFNDLKKQRELPTCPPQLDSDTNCCGWTKGDSFLLHHAALFAATKWTNCYLKGDPIGGPLNSILGSRIRDVELDDGVKRCKWRNHTRYWANETNPGSKCFRQEVRRVLGIQHIS